MGRVFRCGRETRAGGWSGKGYAGCPLESASARLKYRPTSDRDFNQDLDRNDTCTTQSRCELTCVRGTSEQRRRHNDERVALGGLMVPTSQKFSTSVKHPVEYMTSLYQCKLTAIEHETASERRERRRGERGGEREKAQFGRLMCGSLSPSTKQTPPSEPLAPHTSKEDHECPWTLPNIELELDLPGLQNKGSNPEVPIPSKMNSARTPLLAAQRMGLEDFHTKRIGHRWP